MADSLEDLANRKPLSKAAKLEAALPEIDAALAARATHKEILAALNERGFNLSFTVYQTTLFRIRNSQKKDKTRAPATPTTTKETPAAAPKTSSGKQPFVFDKTPAKDIWK